MSDVLYTAESLQGFCHRQKADLGDDVKTLVFFSSESLEDLDFSSIEILKQTTETLRGRQSLDDIHRGFITFKEN